MSDLSQFIVVTNAVVVTRGKRANGRAAHARVLHGGIITASPDSEQIERLLALGAIRHVGSAEDIAKYRAQKPVPVGKLAKIAGAADDPVHKPLKDVQPFVAPSVA